MTHCTNVAGRRRRHRGPGPALLLALAMVAAGCGMGTAATFSPAGPCTVDGQRAGAYPELEALVPASLGETPRSTLDSGRSCTETALGAFVSHDLDEVRFAGGTWDLGDGRYVSSVVFADPAGPLPAEWVAEFYEIGARTAKRTENIETSRQAYDGAGEAWRLDTLNELDLQSVVTWQDGDVARAVLVSTRVAPDASRAAHDALIADAVASAVAASGGGG